MPFANQIFSVATPVVIVDPATGLADSRSKTVVPLQTAATATGKSACTAFRAGPRSAHATISGTGVVTAAITWYGNNNNDVTTGVAIATSTLSGTTTDQTGISLPEWPFHYSEITMISGTGATVNTTVGG